MTHPLNRSWRTVDIVVAAVLAVAFGVVFWAWGLLWNGPAEAIPLPGRAVLYGLWLLPGVLGALVIRKPGAAFFTDAVAIALALVALRLAQRPPEGGFTYGLRRGEILSAAINGVTLLLLGGLIVYEAVKRLIDPPEVEGLIVVVVAVVGIVVNLAAVRLIASAERQDRKSTRLNSSH